jgi:tRNA A-37 threonylcarbamoyl transferase component Bud32
MEHEAADGSADRFGERYTDLRPVGRGTSATVHRAYSPHFARDVALKVFLGGVLDEDVRRRFNRECQVLGTLADHPHVVSVFDSGFTSDGEPYIVMAYCAGGSFGQRLAGQGPRPAEEVAVVGIAVADALAAAHERGIVHRDVKPQNVLLTGYGVVALADFGVASGPLADLRSFAATPGYVAPEVVAGPDRGGPAADVYALGATLYALLTGGPPHRQRPEEADVAYLMRAAATPPPPLGPEVPPGLADVVRDCLRPDPAERPADAATVRRRLREAAAAAGLELPERIDVSPAAAVSGARTTALLPGARSGPDAATWLSGADAAPAAAAGATWLPAPGPATRTAPPGAPTSWPRRLAVAGLGAGLVAAGMAGGAFLRPAADGATPRTIPGPAITVTTPPATTAGDDAVVEPAGEKPRKQRTQKRKAQKTTAPPPAGEGPAERRKDNSGKGSPGPAKDDPGKGGGKTP